MVRTTQQSPILIYLKFAPRAKNSAVLAENAPLRSLSVARDRPKRPAPDIVLNQPYRPTFRRRSSNPAAPNPSKLKLVGSGICESVKYVPSSTAANAIT